MVTPLSAPDELDLPGCHRLIEHIIKADVGGLFILGTTGEGPSLSNRLRRQLITEVCRTVAGRVPVLVAITDTSMENSVRLAQVAADCGAQAVVAAPPSYFPITQKDLLQYTRKLVAEAPLPLIIYNIPSHTKVSFDLETLRRLTDIPNIIGVKDSSGDMTYFSYLLQITQTRPDWSILIGPEELLGPALLAGGNGGISGGANLFPEIYVALYKAALRKDLQTVNKLQEIILQLSTTVYSVGSDPGSFIKTLKFALHCSGICSDLTAQPLGRLSADNQALVRSNLEKVQQAQVVGEPEAGSIPPLRITSLMKPAQPRESDVTSERKL